MSLCDVCGAESELRSCNICGARVCRFCVNYLGICKNCARGRQMK